jgi:hypothetical protein
VWTWLFFKTLHPINFYLVSECLSEAEKEEAIENARTMSLIEYDVFSNTSSIALIAVTPPSIINFLNKIVKESIPRSLDPKPIRLPIVIPQLPKKEERKRRNVFLLKQ